MEEFLKHDSVKFLDHLKNYLQRLQWMFFLLELKIPP